MCGEQQGLACGGVGVAGEALQEARRPRHRSVPVRTLALTGDGRSCGWVLSGEGPLWRLCGGQNEGEAC